MVDTNIAQAIMVNLESGTVPVKYVNYYDVGRNDQVQIVLNEIEVNSAKLRFVNGDYGTGKTHFLANIRHQALKKGYVPSHVVLSSRGTPLYDLRAVYSRIMKNLVLEDQDLESPIEAVLEFIFREFKEWLKSYMGGRKRSVSCSKYSIDPLYCHHCNETGVIEKLYIHGFEELDEKLQIAIIIYRWAKWGYNPDFKTVDLVIRWLEGTSV